MKETHLRSVTKGLSWRIVGTLDTMLLSYLFTGSILNTLQIGFSELFTKIPLFYLHERIWLKVKFGRIKYYNLTGELTWKDAKWRSFIKGFSWRMFGTLDTILLALLWTGDYGKALSIGFAELFTKIILYYLHERVWGVINWGSPKQKEAKSNSTFDNSDVEFTAIRKSTN